MAVLQGKKILAGSPTPKITENKVIEITKSAYEELEAENKVVEDQIYLIKDENSANAVINDIDIGLESAYSSQHTQLLLDEKANKANTYAKSEVNSLVNSKLTSVMRYKGKVADVASLPAEPSNGDTYIVEADSIARIYNEDNSVWDSYASLADLTNYYTITEIDEMLATYNAKFQYNVMPEAANTFTYPIQYIGSTNANYINGNWYKIKNDNDVLSWERIDKDHPVKYDFSLTATANINNDIKSLLDEIDGLNEDTYTGSFIRSGVGNGHYTITKNSNGVSGILITSEYCYTVSKSSSQYKINKLTNISDIGDLSLLDTLANSDLVSAINETKAASVLTITSTGAEYTDLVADITTAIRAWVATSKHNKAVIINGTWQGKSWFVGIVQNPIASAWVTEINFQSYVNNSRKLLITGDAVNTNFSWQFGTENVFGISTENTFRGLHMGSVGIKISADLKPSGTNVTIPADTIGTYTAGGSYRHFIGNDQSGNVYSWVAKSDGTNVIRKI